MLNQGLQGPPKLMVSMAHQNSTPPWPTKTQGVHGPPKTQGLHGPLKPRVSMAHKNLESPRLSFIVCMICDIVYEYVYR